MARNRTSGWRGPATGQARRELRRGVAARDVIENIAERFPNVRTTEIRRIVAREGDRYDRLETLRGENFGHFASAETTAGCTGRRDGSRVSLEIRFIEPDTGRLKVFNGEVDVFGWRKVGDLFTEAVAALTRQAREMGYHPPDFGRVNKANLDTFSPKFVDCI